MQSETPPKISIVIPTYNRPLLLERSLRSVLMQTYSNIEVIVVDDGDKERAKEIVTALQDSRVIYVENDPPKRGGGATRNVGIKLAKGEWIAFQDDDDEWLPNKLQLQMDAVRTTAADVGFCFTAVLNDFGDHQDVTTVRPGVLDYCDIALRSFAGFLTVTLLFRANILREVGGFDESLPSHQEPELMIRVTRTYKGLGINQPLVRVNMTPHEQIGSSFERRIRGREIILEKHSALLSQYPKTLAYHYFQMGIWCRDSDQMSKAKTYFFKAFRLSKNPRHLAHALLALYKKDFVCQ